VKTITEDILSWSKDFVELPNKHLGNLPTCPYAKTARLKGQIKIVEEKKANNLLITVIKQCEIIKQIKERIIIVGCDDLSMTADELIDYVHALNHVFVPKDVYLMCHHPQDGGEDEPVEFLEDTEWYPENEFMMVLVQPFMELENASEHLSKTGFYDNWTKDYYEGTVKKRQSYRRLYNGWNEKKSK
tara:strand:- start:256 stop:816 length:561 start_codon:yes stop_codon:yes gene_type:complete